MVKQKNDLAVLMRGLIRSKRKTDALKEADRRGELTDDQRTEGWHFCQAAGFELRQVPRAWKCYSCEWEVPGREEGKPLDKETRRRTIVAMGQQKPEDL